MKKLLAVVMVLAISTSLTSCVKVIKTDELSNYTGETEFDATASVNDLWDSAVEDITSRAVNLPDFLTEANGDLKSLVDKYGKYSMGTSGTISYPVKGSGIVTEVDTESKAGYIVVKLDDYDGSEVIKIQVGPVYKGSSTRDNLSMIDFGDYTNQEEWAAISKQLNESIDEKVIAPADPANLEGKSIDFVGTFEADSDDELLITPISLNVK